MSEIFNILITIYFSALGYCIFEYFALKYEGKQIDRMIQRSEEVYNFRIHVLYNYSIEVYDSMPSYDEMMWSRLPLEPKYWLNGSY